MSKSALALALMAAAALAAPPRQAAEMEPLLARAATYEYGQSREALAAFTEFVQQSMGSPELLKQIEARLLRFLQSGATAAGKDFAFRELSLIATNASIPVLAPLLTDAAFSQMARYALARIPGPAADEALRQALEKAEGKVRIGIINSLGERRDPKSVPALRALAGSADPAAAEAAVAALAAIADRPALAALGALLGQTGGELRQRVAEAYLQCADQFRARGDRSAAAKVYRQLNAPQESRMVRIGALAGLAAAEGKEAVPALSAALESNDQPLQAAAIRFLSGIPGAGITEVLVKEYAKLPAPGQARLLAALADRGDASARPLVVSALASPAPEVRTAALGALGRLGDSSSVLLLAEAAAAGEGAAQNAARQSLYGLRGAGIDSAVAAAIGPAGGKVKIELIMAAGERGTAAAAEALIQAVGGADAEVRREALRALRNVAGPAQVPALLDLLLQAPGAADRREATQTLASVLRRAQPAPVGALLAAYQAAPAVETRLSLLEVLGQTSNPEALPLLRAGLSNPSPEIVRASILALSGWDSPAPLADLLGVAKGGGDPALQILALRGYLKLAALPSARPASESARLLAEGMRLARQPAEKRTVLSLLATYPCPESLAVAKASLGDEAVAKEAKAAVSQIENALKPR
jgi:HEAT repeat protein